jgi:hypothetical protein
VKGAEKGELGRGATLLSQDLLFGKELIPPANEGITSVEFKT